MGLKSLPLLIWNIYLKENNMIIREENTKITHDYCNIRKWDEYVVTQIRINQLTKMITDVHISYKKRGTSSQIPRYERLSLMNTFNIPHNDQPNNIKDYSFNLASFKTPLKYDPLIRKRLSSFNENKRRPINILTIPKKGDNNSDSGSMSSIKSEDNKIDFLKYSKHKGNK